MVAPLALFGLVALPIIVAFYMLRLRRRDVPVGSTFLWQQLIRDVEANAPWQRLRFSWLLLVQLLIALLVVLAATRPFTAGSSELAANVVLVVDTSASMGAVDDDGPRIAAARDAARDVVDRIPDGGVVTVVAADDTAHVLVSETDDRAAALDAIDRLEATQLPGDFTDAFALATALAERDADSTVVLVTDAGTERLPPGGIDSPVQVERVGASDDNQAIAALSALRRSGGAQLDVFVAVANHGSADVTRRLELYADGELADARDLQLGAGARSEALVSTIPPSATVLEARLAGEDALAVDDRAYAVVADEERTRALLVGPGNTYLENALALLPRLELFAVGEAGYEDALAEAEREDAPYGLLIFDRFVPDAEPRLPLLYVDPPEDGRFGTVGGRIEAPVIDRAAADEPLLRFVDLSTVHLGRAREIGLADGVRPLVESTAGAPLVAAGQVGGARVALVGFALSESDLPLQVAFPLLMSNLVDYLLPAGDGVLPPASALGEPIPLALDPAVESVTLVEDGVASAVGLVGGRGTLPGAQRIGIRELRDADGTPLGRVAANLFSPDESDVAPGDPMRLVDMGRFVDPGETAQTTRSEWWWPLALAALALLAVEWLLFHRPTRRSVERLIRRRPGSGRGASGGARPQPAVRSH
jgi:Ca-activated chloride channel family protein